MEAVYRFATTKGSFPTREGLSHRNYRVSYLVMVDHNLHNCSEVTKKRTCLAGEG